MFREFITKHNLANFRILQLWQYYYQKGVTDASKITVWPLTLRDELQKEQSFEIFNVITENTSKDASTTKVLLERKVDGKRLESVLMRHKSGRNTVCVSCMIGCPVGCVFCATGKLGFQANLTADEIVEQVLYFERKLLTSGENVSNVVFMGMGEPLLNLDNVLEAIAIMTDPKKMGMSDRRIAISTSGYYRELPRLLEAEFKGKLAISLHAPNQELRVKLMPMAKAYPLDELLKALDDYVAVTNKRILYEYLLLQDINDKPEHALELAKLLKGRLAHVNLIPFNSVQGSPLKQSQRQRINAFESLLLNAGISVTIRASMGADIDGACGQLAAKTK